MVSQLRVTAEAYTAARPSAIASPLYWITYLAGSEGLGIWFTALVLVGSLVAVRRLDRRVAALLVFTAAYFLVVSVATLRFERNLLPLFPVFAILAGIGIAAGLESTRRLVQAVALAVLVVSVTVSAWEDVRIDRRIDAPDTRTVAIDWINANIPPGSSIAREYYTPQLDPGRYSARVLVTLATHPVEWYRAQGVDYLITSGSARSMSPDQAFYDALGPKVDLPGRSVGCHGDQPDDPGDGYPLEPPDRELRAAVPTASMFRFPPDVWFGDRRFDGWRNLATYAVAVASMLLAAWIGLFMTELSRF